MRQEEISKTFCKFRNALIRKEENPYEIEEKLKKSLERISFSTPEDRETYLPELQKRLETISLYPEEKFSEKLETYLEDIRYYWDKSMWNTLMWKWREEEYREIFMHAVLEQMKFMKLSVSVKKKTMPKIMRAYENVMEQEPLYRWAVNRKPPQESDWLEELENSTLEEGGDLYPIVLASNLFFSISPRNDIAPCFSTYEFDEKLRIEILKALSC